MITTLSNCFFLSPQTTRRARWAPKIFAIGYKFYNTITFWTQQTRHWLHWLHWLHCCFYTSAVYKPIVGLGQYSWALWITLSEPIMFTSDRWAIVPGRFSSQNVHWYNKISESKFSMFHAHSHGTCNLFCPHYSYSGPPLSGSLQVDTIGSTACVSRIWMHGTWKILILKFCWILVREPIGYYRPHIWCEHKWFW